VYGKTTKPSFTRICVARMSSSVSGNKVCWSPITSSLTQFDNPTSRPKRAARTRLVGVVASSRIRQNKYFLAVNIVKQ